MPETSPPNPLYAPPPRERRLPFSFAWPLAAGVAAGGLLRWVFSGDPGGPYATMMWSFIFLSPLLVGAITVYAAERIRRRSVGYWFGAGFLANVLYVAGTLVINLEGWICAILIVPLFAVIGGLGGLLMGAICRLTRWPRHATYSLAVLPLLLGGLEQRVPLPDHHETVQRTILVQAPPERVWERIVHADRIRPEEIEGGWMYRIGVPLPDHHETVRRTILVQAPPERVWERIVHADRIRPEEIKGGWMYRIGVPLPESGMVERTGDGRVRHIAMGRGIRFDQVVTDWRPGRHVAFAYAFAPDSFPPRALDDHVRIGGHYFDLIDTAYTLEPRGGATALTVSMRYRVSTQFNWYAAPIARFLVGDFEDTILRFYRRRSEAPAGHPAADPATS